MYRPVHGVEGYLLSDIDSLDSSMLVDDATAAILSRVLEYGTHYTYLMLREGLNYELVRTAAIKGNQIGITRGQDSSTPQDFTSASTSVLFVLSASAIADIIQDKALGEVELVGAGIVTVTKLATNSYSISAPEVTLESDTDQVLVGGSFPDFTISAPEKKGCC